MVDSLDRHHPDEVVRYQLKLPVFFSSQTFEVEDWEAIY